MTARSCASDRFVCVFSSCFSISELQLLLVCHWLSPTTSTGNRNYQVIKLKVHCFVLDFLNRSINRCGYSWISLTPCVPCTSWQAHEDVPCCRWEDIGRCDGSNRGGALQYYSIKLNEVFSSLYIYFNGHLLLA